MRGTMAADAATGAVTIAGRWAIRAADFADAKLCSGFEYTLQPGGATAAALAAGPASGLYCGGFKMKLQGRSRLIKEDNVHLQFKPAASGGGFTLHASGSNEFGAFSMHGTAAELAAGDASSAGPRFTVEIFRAYTSFAEPPALVPRSGPGWAVVGPSPGASPAPKPALARQQSAPAAKEPRSGASAPAKAPKSNFAPVEDLDGAGRARKPPTKLVDEMAGRGAKGDRGGGDGQALLPVVKTKLEGLLRQLRQNRDSVYFLEPVDPVKLGIPTYFDVVRHPMDLGTVDRNLAAGVYATPEQLCADVRLVFSNSRLFNPDPTLPVSIATAKLAAFFEGKWADFDVWRRKKEESAREAAAAAASAVAATSAKAMARASSTASMQRSASTKSIASDGGGGVQRKRGGGGGGGGGDDDFKALTERMFAMSAEILELQRAATTQTFAIAAAAAAPATGKKKGSARSLVPDDAAESVRNTVPLTYEEKELLTKQIDKLPAHKLNRVIQIVQEQMQLSGFNDNDEEIELDVDHLPIPTLRALQAYVKECQGPAKKEKPEGAPKAARKPKATKALPIPAGPSRASAQDPGGASSSSASRASPPPPAKRAKASSPPAAQHTAHGQRPAAAAPANLDTDSEGEGPPQKKAAHHHHHQQQQKQQQQKHCAPATYPVPANQPAPTAYPAAVSAYAAPEAASAPTPGGRRIAGLDDSDDDEDEEEAVASGTAPPAAAAVLAPAPVARVTAVAAVAASVEIQPSSAGVWGACDGSGGGAAGAWGAMGDGAGAGRGRSDSVDDDGGGWGQLRSEVAEQQQRDEYRAAAQAQLAAAQQQQQLAALDQAAKLREASRKAEAEAAARQVAEAAGQQRQLAEARAAEVARTAGGGQTVDLDAVAVRNDVASFMDEFT